MTLAVALILLVSAVVDAGLSWDRQWRAPEDVYRLHLRTNFPDRPSTESAQTSGRLAALVRSEVPNVNGVARLSIQRRAALRYQQKELTRTIAYADSTIGEVLQPTLVAGTLGALAADRAWISEELAQALVGTDEVQQAVGEVVEFAEGEPVAIAAVVRWPRRTHLDVAAFVNGSVSRAWATDPDNLPPSGLFTYMRSAASPEALASALERVQREHFAEPERTDWTTTLLARPLLALYLSHTTLDDVTDGGSRNEMRLLGLIAAVVLLLASSNLISVAFARTLGQLRALGIRRSLGANGLHLWHDNLVQYAPVVLLAGATGVVLAVASAPVLGPMLGAELTAWDLFDPRLALVLALTLLCLAASATWVPTLLATRSTPAVLLRQTSSTPTATGVRGALTTLQFAAAVIIASMAMLMQMQSRHATSTALGYDPKGVDVYVLPGQVPLQAREDVVRELDRLPEVKSAAGTWLIPGAAAHSIAEVSLVGAPSPVSVSLSQLSVSDQFLRTLEGDLLAGRWLQPEQTVLPDTPGGEGSPPVDLVVNERALQALGFRSPQAALGQQVRYLWAADQFHPAVITGVVQDFRLRSAREAIYPTGFFNSPDEYRFALVRSAGDQALTRAAVQRALTARFPEQPVQTASLSTLLNRQVAAELEMAWLLLALAVVTLITASLGFMGLALEMAQSSRRESAIRRALGARASEVVGLLVMRSSWPALIGGLLAIPVSFLVAHQWLEAYASRVSAFQAPVLGIALIAILIAGALAAALAARTTTRQTALELQREVA
ncbi:MAG: FtsX-like permease family protein [Pseudomonadota bacterium]